MYQGEANVNEENLPCFLEIAEDLMLGVFAKETQKVLNWTEKRLHKSTIHLQRKKISMTKSIILLATIILLMILILKHKLLQKIQMMNLNKYMFRTTRKML